MSTAEFTRKAQHLQTFLDSIAQTMSRETGFVQRTSKLTGATFLQTLVLGWLNRPNASLNQLVQISADLGVQISEAGLQQRINPAAVGFLQALLPLALNWFRQTRSLPDTLLSHFHQINIVDSSLLVLPPHMQTLFRGARVHTQAAELKVQLSFDYLSGHFNAIELLEGRSPDQKSGLPLQTATTGSLTLVDLGFFRKTLFEEIAQAGGYFLSRLQSQTALYTHVHDTKALDLPTVLSRSSTRSGELRLYLHAQQRLAVRLVYHRLPDPIVAQRRRKALAKGRRRKEKRSTHHLALLAWSVYITNIPSDWLSAEQVMLMYRLRWQIELVFKLWKSQAKLQIMGPWRPERILCQFLARLLGLILFQWSVIPYRWMGEHELSLAKAFSVLQRYIPRLLNTIGDHWRGVAHVLQTLGEDFQHFALKNKRRKSPSTFQRLVYSTA